MWNPFRKKQPQPVANPLEAMMKAMIEKSEEEERPYGSTRIGFGASIKARTVCTTEA